MESSDKASNRAVKSSGYVTRISSTNKPKEIARRHFLQIESLLVPVWSGLVRSSAANATSSLKCFLVFRLAFGW